MGMDKSLSRRLSIDYKSAPPNPKVMELLKFCEKLTTNPGDMRRADIEQFRELGWNDAAIFDCPGYVALRDDSVKQSDSMKQGDSMKKDDMKKDDNMKHDDSMKQN